MDRMQLTEVRPRSAGERSLAMVVAVAMVVVAIAFAGAAVIIRGQLPIAPIGASPSPSAGPTTGPTSQPTAWPTVGTSWVPITDGDLVGKPQGSLTGVIAGRLGAIAWGDVYGVGPRIWYSADGRAWTQADVEAPADYWVDQKSPGSVLSVTAGGPGFVAVGVYVRASDRLQTGLVWTSADGRTWTRVPRSPVFDDAYLGQVVAWGGRLIAYGCAGCGMQGGPTTVWTSSDGTTWTKTAPVLPSGLIYLGPVTVGTDALWGTGQGSPGGYLPPPVRVTSTDGITWATTTALPLKSGERLHALPDALYVTSDQGFAGAVYRSADGTTWAPLGRIEGLPSDLVRVGDQLVAVGRAPAGCDSGGGPCVATAWRSLDVGATTTWSATTIAGTPAAQTRSGIEAVVALSDGTLIAVGSEGTTPSTAAWFSAPVR